MKSLKSLLQPTDVETAVLYTNYRPREFLALASCRLYRTTTTVGYETIMNYVCRVEHANMGIQSSSTELLSRVIMIEVQE